MPAGYSPPRGQGSPARAPPLEVLAPGSIKRGQDGQVWHVVSVETQGKVIGPILDAKMKPLVESVDDLSSAFDTTAGEVDKLKEEFKHQSILLKHLNKDVVAIHEMLSARLVNKDDEIDTLKEQLSDLTADLAAATEKGRSECEKAYKQGKDESIIVAMAEAKKNDAKARANLTEQIKNLHTKVYDKDFEIKTLKAEIEKRKDGGPPTRLGKVLSKDHSYTVKDDSKDPDYQPGLAAKKRRHTGGQVPPPYYGSSSSSSSSSSSAAAAGGGAEEADEIEDDEEEDEVEDIGAMLSAAAKKAEKK